MSEPSRTGRKSSQLVVLVMVIALSIPVGLVLMGMWIFDTPSHPLHTPRPFEQAAWARFEEDDVFGYSSRLPMAQWLATTRTLDGMSREAVEELLGRPDERHRRTSGIEAFWEVGVVPSVIDPETGCLFVRFDPEDRAVECAAPGN